MTPIIKTWMWKLYTLVPDSEAVIFCAGNRIHFTTIFLVISTWIPMGLINTINYSSEDKTPVILNDLLTTAVNIGKIANSLGFSPFAIGGAGGGANRTPLFFDPFDEAEVRIVKKNYGKSRALNFMSHPTPAHGAP